MQILHYETAGGKDLIDEYIQSLTVKERVEIEEFLAHIEEKGMRAIQAEYPRKTRQIEGKLWEIKISSNRLFYVIIDKDLLAILHACKKQKGKAEKKNIRVAKERMKEVF